MGVLCGFLRAKLLECQAQGLPTVAAEVIARFVGAGGKRMRPRLCLLGWMSAGGAGDHEAVVRVAAGLELFHAAALIHDDVMDDSADRRGQPTVHRAMTVRHQPDRPAATAARLGRNLAILIGDFALAWSSELLHTACLPQDRLLEVLRLDAAMRTETMYGQYLDLTAEGSPTADIGRAVQIARYKTAAYTVQRPLQIGAAAAGASPALLDALSDYALPLGEAFQFRDDLLGVFGDCVTTGKSALDDLRAGKHTTVLAVALDRAAPADADALRRLLATPGFGVAEAERVRVLLERIGARAEVERLIQERCHRSQRALSAAGLPEPVSKELGRIAQQATVRTS
ncbi:polyprenyl synthetase [Streptomyces sp. A012304]|nr:polyprenyl synthetase [Streptomyces sp. A012304]